MKTIEIILMILAYTVITITLFIEIICYKKKIETIETILFTAALFLLIVSITIPSISTLNIAITDAFLYLSMTLVALTTILNVLDERQHRIKNVYKTLLVISSTIIALLIVINYFTNIIAILPYIVEVFLVLAVVFSMLLIKFTKPVVRIEHREKIEQIMSIAFLILIPLLLCSNYTTLFQNYTSKIGFTLPLIFIILALSKLWDDIKRLSLFTPETGSRQENIQNYGLTNREKEVALLLGEGKTYKEVSEGLFISIPTVKTHTSNIYKKCKIKNKTELTILLIS